MTSYKSPGLLAGFSSAAEKAQQPRSQAGPEGRGHPPAAMTRDDPRGPAGATREAGAPQAARSARLRHYPRPAWPGASPQAPARGGAARPHGDLPLHPGCRLRPRPRQAGMALRTADSNARSPHTPASRHHPAGPRHPPAPACPAAPLRPQTR